MNNAKANQSVAYLKTENLLCSEGRLYHSKAKDSINMQKASGDLAVIGTGP
jgi:hypothetical protein